MGFWSDDVQMLISRMIQREIDEAARAMVRHGEWHHDVTIPWRDALNRENPALTRFERYALGEVVQEVAEISLAEAIIWKRLKAEAEAVQGFGAKLTAMHSYLMDARLCVKQGCILDCGEPCVLSEFVEYYVGFIGLKSQDTEENLLSWYQRRGVENVTHELVYGQLPEWLPVDM